MKTFTFFVSFLFAIAVLQAQNYQISFTGSGQSITIDSIQIENLTQGTVLSLYGDDILNLVGTVGINTLITNESNEKIYPNPMVESSFVEFDNSKTELVCLEIFNEMGILIAKQSTLVQQGRQRFKISGLNAGIYNVNVSAVDWKYTAKLISLGKTAGNTAIEYQGTDEGSSPKNAIKSTKNLVQMQYNDGERILFKGFSGIYTHVLTLLPTQSQTVNFEFISCSDEDGNNYAVVIIGTQTWMAENLSTTKYNDGTNIPHITDNGAWDALTTPAYCWYDNDSATNASTYGALYNWYVVDTSILCPTGWHVPSDEEWKTMEMHLGMSQSEADDIGWRGTDEGGKMKSTSGWYYNGNATNSSGFNALPGGSRYGYGSFYGLGSRGYWWSSTEPSGTNAWGRSLYVDYDQVYRYYYYKSNGFSVRCLKN